MPLDDIPIRFQDPEDNVFETSYVQFHKKVDPPLEMPRTSIMSRGWIGTLVFKDSGPLNL